MNFSWTAEEESAGTNSFDADATDDRLLRAVLSGTSIYVYGRYSDGAWSEIATGTTAGSLSSVPPALYCDGSTVRLFYQKAGSLCYKQSTDSGTTFGAEVAIGTLADIKYIAPVSLTKVHVITYDGYNSRPHYYEYSGSWAKTSSAIYFPGEFGSFDAVSVSNYDSLVFDAPGQVRYDTSRQGIWYLRQRQGDYADPAEIDVLDERETDVTERRHAMVSYIDNKAFVTFVALDAGFTNACYTTSASGRFWQHRQPMGAIDRKVKMLELGDTIYCVGSASLYSSAATPIVGNPTVEVDITDRVTSYSGQRGRAYQSRIIIDNDDGTLTDLSTFDTWRIKEMVGYLSTAGVSLLVQYALTLLDAVGIQNSTALSDVQVTARDYMALLTDHTEADHYEEWESQLKHWDNFENAIDSTTQKTILDSGRRYTFTQSGYWSTEDNELRLLSNNKEGLSLCTADKFIGNTIVQEAIQVATAGNNEWAGVVVRCRDEDNYWLAYYDQATDKIKLRKKEAGVWQSAVAETSALSWSVGTWYWIRVEARLSLYIVYYSTDGADWTQAFTYVDQTMGDTPSTDLVAFQEGYVGHNGYGYSDEDVEPYEPDPYIPPYVPPPPAEDPYAWDTRYYQFIIASLGGAGAWALTDDVINEEGTFEWTSLKGNLGTRGELIYDMTLSQELQYLYACTNDGLYRTTLPLGASPTWTCLVSEDDLDAVLGYETYTYWTNHIMSRDDPLKQWTLVERQRYGWPSQQIITMCLYTTDGWATWNYSNLCAPGQYTPDTWWRNGLILEHDSGDQILYATSDYGGWNKALYKSTDGGASWTFVQSIGSYGFRLLYTRETPGTGTKWHFLGRQPASGTGYTLHTTNEWASTTQLVINDVVHVHGRLDELVATHATLYWMYYFNFDTEQWTKWMNYDSQILEDYQVVGWGTNNVPGYVIFAGRSSLTPPTNGVLMWQDDDGDSRNITHNYNTVINYTNATPTVICKDGGNFIE